MPSPSPSQPAGIQQVAPGSSRSRGPAVVEFAESTCLVRPGWQGTVDEVGTLVLTWGPA